MGRRAVCVRAEWGVAHATRAQDRHAHFFRETHIPLAPFTPPIHPPCMPPMQANKWVRSMEASRQLVVLKPSTDANYLRQLAAALPLGRPVLLEGLGECHHPCHPCHDDVRCPMSDVFVGMGKCACAHPCLHACMHACAPITHTPTGPPMHPRAHASAHPCIRASMHRAGESLDASLEPVLLKLTFKSGGSTCVKLGDQVRAEVAPCPCFRWWGGVGRAVGGVC